MDVLGNFSEAFGYLGKTTAAILFIIGAAECFFGYKLFKLWIAICGFIFVGMAGIATGNLVFDSYGIGLALFFAGGILGAILGIVFYKLGVFSLCGVTGFLLGVFLTGEPVPSIILAVIVGIVGVLLVKPVVIVTTGISGGLLAGAASQMYAGPGVPALVVSAVLIIAGIYVQFVMNKPKVALNTAEEKPLSVNTEQPLAAPQTQSQLACSECGQHNPEGANFCKNCGKPLLIE